MNEFIKIKTSSPKKGRGAFTKKDIKEGTIIDVAHVLLIPNEEYSLIRKTILDDYVFTWDDPNYDGEYSHAISLSITQYMNHSYEPNVKYLYNYKNKTIKFYAIRDVKRDEELTINYNGIVDDKSAVWFDVE